MQRQEGEIMVFDQTWKHSRKPKFREVSSRFLLSPTNNNNNNSVPVVSNGNGNQSPTHYLLSPIKQKPTRSSTDNSRNLKTLENSGLIRGLWPSAASQKPSSPKDDRERETLADHLGNDRLKDLELEFEHERHKNQEKSSDSPMSFLLHRQRSCTEFTRFEKEKRNAKENEKHHHKPLFGSSIRYTGKFRFPRISSASSSSSTSSSSCSKSPKSDDYNDSFVPGRLSMDETALRKRNSWRKKSDYLSDLRAESESEQSVCSGNSFCSSPVTGKNYTASYMAPTVSSRMSGIEVPSKYMQQDHPSRRRTNATAVADSSPKKSSSSSSFMLKNAKKRSNSGIDPTMNMNTNKWGSSPGRTGSTSPNVKPPTSPSKVAKGGVGNFLSMGLELLKGKKSSTNVVTSSPLGLTMGENVHQLRLFHNRLVQWRYANAKAETANGKTCKKVENNLKYGWDAITKLQQSVKQKKLQIEKEKLEMTLYQILQSQIKALESWGDMEREHLSSVNMTKDCLHSVVCRVPLTEGAKVAPESASIVLRDASDFTASINLMLSDFPHVADKTAGIFAELAEIVTQEKLLLEECLEIFKFISDLEVQEKSLKSYVMQMKIRSEKQSLHKNL